MTALRTPLRTGWLLGIAIGCVAIGVVVFTLSRTMVVQLQPRPTSTEIQHPVLRIAQPRAPSGAVGWGVHSAMNDLSPLFLPSDRNARLPALPLREPGDGTLDAQTAMFRFRESDASITASFPATTSLNGKPLSQAVDLDGLRADDTASLAAGFGRLPVVLVPAGPRGALIEIYASGSGQIVEIKEISDDAHFPWPQIWQPLEFLAAVESAGLVSPLSLTVASGIDSVDGFFRDYLARTFRVGERLAPGFYRIVVSP